MNRRAKVYLRAADIVDRNWLHRMFYFYTAINDAGGTVADEDFGVELFGESGVASAPVHERILALCFLAAIAEDE